MKVTSLEIKLQRYRDQGDILFNRFSTYNSTVSDLTRLKTKMSISSQYCSYFLRSSSERSFFITIKGILEKELG